MIKQFKDFRNSTLMYSLIKVEEKMGIPYQTALGLFYIPFFQQNQDTIIQTSFVVIDQELKHIYQFQCLKNSEPIVIDLPAFMEFKQMAIQQKFRYTIQQIPATLQNVYQQLKEI